jgi:hypothetical protein
VLASKHYWKIVTILFLIVIINIPLLYLIYDDLLFVFFVPLMSSGIDIGGAMFLERFGLTSRRYMVNRPFSERGGLIPSGAFLAGLFWSQLSAWDDIFFLSDSLVEPWFWSMVVCSYAGWLIGIASYRYYRIKKISTEKPLNL